MYPESKGPPYARIQARGYPWTRRRLQGAPLCLEELTGNNKYFNFLVFLWI